MEFGAAAAACAQLAGAQHQHAVDVRAGCVLQV
jgi:hypothetical protein